ncbi:MAG: 7-carboxy-7-deazaguanine synthase QueE [Akkermansiaceae bacterium]|nr:7-carboxy-7-deazaguanine synthase QueE [Akkermansiaceae bacterium]
MKLARLPDGTPEIFHTLQGEGLSTGKPAIFIRSSLCNLHCQWCDTDYTWNWEGTPWTHDRDREPGYAKFRKEDQIIDLSPSDVAETVRSFPCHHLVLTGGEPLLHDADFVEILTILNNDNDTWTAEVETNGTLTPSSELDALITQYNVSPKLANSGNDQKLRLKEDALTFFASSPKAWFKFVVSAPEDLAEIQDLQSRLALDPDRIFLMPEGRSPEDLALRTAWLVDLCRDQGYRFSQRLHLALWGPKRGK